MPASSKGWSVNFGPVAHVLHAAPLQEQDIQPVGLQPIGQEEVTGAEEVPQRAQQADLALPLAGVAADPEVHNGPTSQGDDGPDPRDREADACPLIVDLRIGFLILGGVRHGDRRAVE